MILMIGLSVSDAQKFKDAFEAAQKAGMEKVMSTPSIDHAKVSTIKLNA